MNNENETAAALERASRRKERKMKSGSPKKHGAQGREPRSLQRLVSCRHTMSWIMGYGHIEWCPECGSVRVIRVTGPERCAANSIWCRPKPGGADYSAWHKASERFNAKMRANGIAHPRAGENNQTKKGE